MKPVYEELNRSYIEVGSIKFPAFVSIDTSYEAGFWDEGIRYIQKKTTA